MTKRDIFYFPSNISGESDARHQTEHFYFITNVSEEVSYVVFYRYGSVVHYLNTTMKRDSFDEHMKSCADFFVSEINSELQKKILKIVLFETVVEERKI